MNPGPTYYELLKLKQTATPDEVRQAFHRFAREAHPDNFVTASSDELQTMAEKYRKVTEAYRILRDSNTRRAYDEALRPHAGGAAQQGISLTSGLKRQSITRLAVPYYRQAQQAMKLSQWKQALLHLQLASRHDPKNEEIAQLMKSVQEKVKAGK